MYENKTAANIRDEILLEIDDAIDKREGSIAYDLTAASATAGEVNFIELDAVLDLGFANTSAGYYLELRCAERGLSRKPAEKSSGEVVFSGEDGLVIAAGTRLITDDDLPMYFVTTEDVTISGGTATAKAEAEAGGLAGNVFAGKIVALAEGEDLAGVVTATNPQAFEGGADEESDTALLQRYLTNVQKPLTSGNAYDYENWAISIAGIAKAKVYPIHAGPGTVKVVLLDEEGSAPDAAKVTEVFDYIESVRPVGAAVTVEGATEVQIDVSATLTLDGTVSTEDVSAEFAELLDDYLRSIAFTDEPVRYSKVASLLIGVTGVEDYAGLSVNGGTSNITIADGSAPVKGVITLA